jgi:hypothetical protein
VALIPSTDCVVRLYCVRFVFMVSRTRGAAHVTLTKAHVILFFLEKRSTFDGWGSLP